MAFDPKPSTWVASWSENATNVTFPIASLPEMTAAEADGTTGDIRKVLFALLNQLFEVYDALAAADKPTMMQMAKSSSVNTAGTEINQFFSVQFTNTVATQDVKDEPA